MTNWRHLRTSRLWLRAPLEADVPAVHDLYADERVWAHVPRARHTSVEQTQSMVRTWQQEWQTAGLGQWLLRADPDDTPVGNVGCAIRDDGLWWSLSYRLHPDVQGQGFASEAAKAAIAAAHDTAPDRPVVASLVEHNTASRAVVERLGFRLVFRGPDYRNPDLGAIRLLFSDRALPPTMIEAISQRR